MRRLRIGLVLLGCSVFAISIDLRAQGLDHLQLLNEIPVAPMGYQEPSSHYLEARLSSETLDFVDEDDLLFTFRHSALLTRHPRAGLHEEEEEVRGIDISLSTNKESARAAWQMGDHGRYLWPKATGQFILRDEAGLGVLSRDLSLQPIISLSDQLIFVALSPDGRRLALESRQGPHVVRLQVLDLSSRTTISHADLNAPADLQLSNDGIFAANASSAGIWIIEDRSFLGRVQPLGEVASSCQPTLKVLGPGGILVDSCDRSGRAHRLQILTYRGRTIWSAQWRDADTWPTIVVDQGASHIGFSVIHEKPCNQCDEETVSRGAQQILRIYRVENQRPFVQLRISPPLSDEANFALSPSGDKLAVLDGTMIMVYRLP